MWRSIDKTAFVLSAALMGMNVMAFKQQGMELFLIYLVIMLLVVGAAMTFYDCLKAGLEQVVSWDMKRLLTGLAVVMAAIGGFLALIVYVEGFSFFSEPGDKKWLFDLAVVILFPALAAWIGKILERDNTRENKIAAISVIAIFQIVCYLLFRPLGITWILWMILLGGVTLWSMIFSISEVTSTAEAESKMRWIFLYVLGWLSVLGLFRGYDTERFYKTVGMKFDASMYIYVVLMVVLVSVLWNYLGRNLRKDKSMYLIQEAAFANLVLRVIFGLSYWLGLSPFAANPPFVGIFGVVMDSVCIAILMKSDSENAALTFDEFDDFEDFEEEEWM